MIDEPLVERRPLPNGFDPWAVPVLNPRLKYEREVEEYGVEVTCENPECGTKFRVHPVNAERAHACGTRCRTKMWRARKRGEHLRPLWHLTWHPERYRKAGK